MPYKYFATVDRVVDGDTLDVMVDLGFKLNKKVRVRLSGVDTAETYGVSHDSEEYRAGKRQEEFTREWLENSEYICVRTREKGKYGRWIATVTNETEESLNHALKQRFNVEQSYS